MVSLQIPKSLETLAIAIENYVQIKGIKIGNEVTKVLQFAGDTTTVLSDINSALVLFQWNVVIKEWKKEAPTFYQILKTIAMPPPPPPPPTISRNLKRKQLLKPIIGSGGAILLKGRNPRLSAVQQLVGLSLVKYSCSLHFSLYRCCCCKLVNPHLEVRWRSAFWLKQSNSPSVLQASILV